MLHVTTDMGGDVTLYASPGAMCQSIQTLVPFSVAGSRSSVMLRERLLDALRANENGTMKKHGKLVALHFADIGEVLEWVPCSVYH